MKKANAMSILTMRKWISVACTPGGVGSALLVVLATVLGAGLTACGYPPTSPYGATGVVGTLNHRALVRGGAIASIARPEVFQAACDIQDALESFRASLGTLNPNQPGSFGSGRREINWDAVPPLFTNTNDFPGDFFNQPTPGRARGVLFSTPGIGLRVSDNDLADLNPTYGEEFGFFSPVRTFISVGDPLNSVDFLVPGTSTPATSRGFGVVFSDIDHPGSGRLRLFDAAGHNLGTYFAPACPGGLSFVGVAFPDPIVARVEILSGLKALGPESFDVSSGNRGPVQDLVIMDDFIYGEPIATQAETTSPRHTSGERSMNPLRLDPQAGGGLDRGH